ncbi:hypothetical protein [Synechococcus sp. MW101C3]|jgi:hypothetical protein|uniref:hypothetical protein n=1 Tax=Synechococcus sp. MW101C3 TaxID=210768 RepID=UPI000B98EDB2|nr:hypothetical protein [Synechococcus sp. MW101C3]
MAAEPVRLQLPPIVTIRGLAKGGSYSGVRLIAVGPTDVVFTKGGVRTVPLAQVASITFQGAVKPREDRNPEMRGEPLKDCLPQPEVRLASAALAIQSDGSTLALKPDALQDLVRKDLRQVGSLRTLVVDSMRFAPGGLVNLAYKACAPGGSR